MVDVNGDPTLDERRSNLGSDLSSRARSRHLMSLNEMLTRTDAGEALGKDTRGALTQPVRSREVPDGL